ALRPRSAEAHDAVVPLHVLADLRADPVDRVRREPRAPARIVALDGLEEADVALLDQVLEGQAAAPVLDRDGDHGGEAALDQGARGGAISAPVAIGERGLGLAAERGAAGDLGPVRREA